MLSSPVIQSNEPRENGHTVEESIGMPTPLESTDTTVPPAANENATVHPVPPSAVSDVVEMIKPATEPQGQFLSVTSIPMGRSSR